MLPFLYKLDISNNKITSLRGLEDLAPDLTIIYALNNNIENEFEVQDIIYFNKLAELDLRKNPFWTEG